MIYFAPVPEDLVTRAFRHTNFGDGQADTHQKRRKIIARALSQRLADFGIGGTVRSICVELGLMTARKGAVTKKGRRFLFDYLRELEAAAK